MLNTKKEFQDCLKRIIKPALPYYTESKTGLKCGSFGVHYGDKTASMEGFARILWGLAPFFCGGGEYEEFENTYISGLANGTNPEHKDYWGKIVDYDQKIVETAAIGLGLIIAADKLWKPLTKEQQNNLYKWLDQVNHVTSCDNNWLFFAVLVNLGLKNVGMPYNEEVIKRSVSRIHEFYIGNGWYTDGKTSQIDYYISFAIHFYSLIYSKAAEKDDPENSRIFKERAMFFAKDFIYWFTESGEALVFGRSLTYRFAQCSFWSACIYAGIEPFPTGIMKGIIARNLEWWLSRPIFDNSGILTVGYAYPNLCMAEDYNGYGSPYWALKAFLILALDENHKFYTENPQPFPKLDKLHVIPEARMVIQRINGDVVALTAGQWADFEPLQVAEKYSKFAYSARYGFSAARSYFKIENCGGDSMLAFVKNDIFYVRRRCIEYKIKDDGTVYSKWSPYDGVEVETYVTPTDDGHIRKHIVTCGEACECYDFSFSVPFGSDGGMVSGEGERVTIKCAPNTNLVHPLTSMSGMKYQLSKGVNTIETKIVYP